jgi:hypothetical protein
MGFYDRYKPFWRWIGDIVYRSVGETFVWIRGGPLESPYLCLGAKGVKCDIAVATRPLATVTRIPFPAFEGTGAASGPALVTYRRDRRLRRGS